MDYLGNVSAPRDLALGHHMDMRRCNVQTFLQREDDLGGRQCYRLQPSLQHTFKNVYRSNEKGVNGMLTYRRADPRATEPTTGRQASSH